MMNKQQLKTTASLKKIVNKLFSYFICYFYIVVCGTVFLFFRVRSRPC